MAKTNLNKYQNSIGKNYIQYFSADNGTTGWRTFDDGAVTRPVNGIDGSPSIISLSTTAVSLLSGSQSFLITKTSASAQGEGVSTDFTIDLED